MISTNHFCFAKTLGHGSFATFPLLYEDPVYLFTVFLVYLYSCANVITKLITKAKAMAIIENLTNGRIIVNRGE